MTGLGPKLDASIFRPKPFLLTTSLLARTPVRHLAPLSAFGWGLDTACMSPSGPACPPQGWLSLGLSWRVPMPPSPSSCGPLAPLTLELRVPGPDTAHATTLLVCLLVCRDKVAFFNAELGMLSTLSDPCRKLPGLERVGKLKDWRTYTRKWSQGVGRQGERCLSEGSVFILTLDLAPVLLLL